MFPKVHFKRSTKKAPVSGRYNYYPTLDGHSVRCRWVDRVKKTHFLPLVLVDPLSSVWRVTAGVSGVRPGPPCLPIRLTSHRVGSTMPHVGLGPTTGRSERDGLDPASRQLGLV